jgi:CHASE3 domain sensor protein
VNIVEYFEMRKREVEEQLQEIESGRVIRLVRETQSGSADVTEQEKQRLRQAIHDYWRAAENLRRINSSQKLAQALPQGESHTPR